jgi:lysophospholipase L1-like esterase
VKRASIGVLAALTVLVACSSEPSGGALDLGAGLGIDGDPGAMGAAGRVAAGADQITSLVMIGDSITKGSREELEQRFDMLGIENVLIEAENGKRMVVSSPENPGGSTVADFLHGDDDHADTLWVVALGTNDVGQYAGPDELAAAVNEVLAKVPEESPLVWVDTYFRDRPEQEDLLNAIVRERVERRGNAVIAPWTSFATTDGILYGDGVHPNEEGAEVFAFVVTDTVRAFLGR